MTENETVPAREDQPHCNDCGHAPHVGRVCDYGAAHGFEHDGCKCGPEGQPRPTPRCQNPCLLEGAEILGTMTYDPEKQTVEFVRAGEAQGEAPLTCPACLSDDPLMCKVPIKEFHRHMGEAWLCCPNKFHGGTQPPQDAERFNQNYVPDSNNPKPRYIQVMEAYARTRSTPSPDQKGICDSGYDEHITPHVRLESCKDWRVPDSPPQIVPAPVTDYEVGEFLAQNCNFPVPHWAEGFDAFKKLLTQLRGASSSNAQLLDKIQKLRFKLYHYAPFDGQSHTTACSIWREDGQGHAEGFDGSMGPCNCGALINYWRERAKTAESKLPALELAHAGVMQQLRSADKWIGELRATGDGLREALRGMLELEKHTHRLPGFVNQEWAWGILEDARAALGTESTEKG